MSRSTPEDGKTCRIAGLDLFIGPGGAWPLECDLSADEPENRARGLDWHKRQVDTAAELGAVAYAGALYAHPGVVKRRRPPAMNFHGPPKGCMPSRNMPHQGSCDRARADEPFPHAHGQYARAGDAPDRSRRPRKPSRPLRHVHIVTEIRSYESALRTVAPASTRSTRAKTTGDLPEGPLPWEEIFSVLGRSGSQGT